MYTAPIASDFIHHKSFYCGFLLWCSRLSYSLGDWQEPAVASESSKRSDIACGH